MLAFGSSISSSRARSTAEPSDELRVAITFPRPDRGPGLTKVVAPLSMNSVKTFAPDSLDMDRALYQLGKMGFRMTKRGRLSASVRCKRNDFERTFGTRLSKFELDRGERYSSHSFYFPEQGAPWQPDPEIASLIDDAYIQWPHIYMSSASVPAPEKPASPAVPAVKPPQVDYFHLDVPGDLVAFLNAAQVRQAGGTGRGIRVAMVDTGFAHTSHPFFASHGFQSTVDLAPRAVNDKTDLNGHGTGESANVFSVAPGATFIGIKVDNDNDPQNGASLLEGFQTAMEHRPHIITISMGYDLRDNNGQLTELPNSLAALEAEVQAAVAAGVIVIFSAGNGHFSFPGMMPDVISAGGVFVDGNGAMQASDYASAFDSKIYSGRHVPDFCGLVGMLPHAGYLMLPVPPGSEIDREMADPNDGQPGDETQPDDGWGAFSGTSAAAPQLAGVCALLLEKNPSLTPADLKALLRSTARDVLEGHANPASSDDMRTPMESGPGDDGATGAGLVDVFAAWQRA
ncbi:MAG: S8 family serine peptidase [Bryobacteraceae bacterium]